MALDDRDRTFEKALARHLRYVAPSGEESGALTSSALPCPDPEILAANHDGSLSPEERALWKAHVLSCDRCQLVLEHLATPVDVPVSVLPDEKVLTAARSAAASTPTPAPTPSSAPAVQILRPAPRKNFFKWLAPAGAVAAGVLAYAAFNTLRTQKSIQPPQSAPVEVAKNEEPRASQYDQAQSTAPADATAKNKETAEAGAARSRMASSAHAESKEEKDVAADSIVNGLSSSASSADEKNLRDAVALAKKAPNVAKGVPGEPQLYVTDGAAAARGANQAANQAQANQKDDKLREQVAALDAEMKKQGVARQAPAAPVPSSAGQAGYLGDNSVSSSAPAKAKAAPAPPPPPPSEAASPKPAETQPARADGDSSLTSSSESVEVANQLQAVASTRLALSQNSHVLEAPGGKASWRFGAAGLIAHSTNKGKDWMLQSSGVDTTLIAGSAPSAKVCWIVGVSGTILRTTDGGSHWIKIASPSSADLAGVRATDALRAFIWFLPDARTGATPSYRTTDGGSTWIPVPAE